MANGGGLVSAGCFLLLNDERVLIHSNGNPGSPEVVAVWELGFVSPYECQLAAPYWKALDSAVPKFENF